MTESAEPGGDPHAANSWENYKHVHDDWMERHPFIVEDHLEWEFVGDPPKIIRLRGWVVCQENVVVTVEKMLIVHGTRNGRLLVQGERYAYNAHFVNRYNILRYDNGHADPEEFHRHQFDLQTGRETSKAIIGRHGMPTLGAFLTEVTHVIGFPIDDF